MPDGSTAVLFVNVTGDRGWKGMRQGMRQGKRCIRSSREDRRGDNWLEKLHSAWPLFRAMWQHQSQKKKKKPATNQPINHQPTTKSNSADAVGKDTFNAVLQDTDRQNAGAYLLRKSFLQGLQNCSLLSGMDGVHVQLLKNFCSEFRIEAEYVWNDGLELPRNKVLQSPNLLISAPRKTSIFSPLS